ncbi:hypothetical protein FDZ71_07380 [bacterium]|nr:MAG: hypothetical protein FDZ71_07380 [bacterium]
MSEVACTSCKQVFPSGGRGSPVCPNCKTRTLSENWSGLLIVLEPEGSSLAKTAGVKKEGHYAVKIGR